MSLIDILAAKAISKAQDRTLDDWDANMRAIGNMLVERYGWPVWRDVFSVFMTQHGLRYDQDEATAFLEDRPAD
jgi:hypothetical protein